ncbi:hypothetical protein BABINDRAFT_163616, partial [Babjeviella inositovora NRRL Y-12698]
MKVIETPNENNEIAGAILLGEEVFEVTLSNSPEDNYAHDQTLKITNGFHVEFNEQRILSIFAAVHPKPDIVVVGLGKKFRVLSESNKKFF